MKMENKIKVSLTEEKKVKLDYGVESQELNAKYDEKSEEISIGSRNSNNYNLIETKEKAIEYYEHQLKGLEMNTKKQNELIANITEQLNGSDIFEKIEKIKVKLDIKKHKGKFKALENYMEGESQLTQAKKHLEINEDNKAIFIQIIADIKAL